MEEVRLRGWLRAIPPDPASSRTTSAQTSGMSRSVKAVYAAVSDDIGDLRTLRPLPNRHVHQIDPFLFLNHHGPQVYPPGNQGLPFGPHPHRGFETVTFIVEGSLLHRDTGGHESVIESGGVQWMTAGRGLEHSELSPEKFLRDGGPLEILQLWVNLPSRLKMTEPRYLGLQRNEIPTTTVGRATVQVISGDWEGVHGPVVPLTDVLMTTVAVPSGERISLTAPSSRNVFFYVVRGRATVAGKEVPAFHLADFHPDGESIDVEAHEDTLLLHGHATPYGESVVSYGPFVMNTQAEIVQAVRDYQAGLFR